MEKEVVTLPTLDVGQYDPWTDTIIIEGTRYSGVIFREGYGMQAAIGQIHQIVSHDNGTVTICRRYDLEQVKA